MNSRSAPKPRVNDGLKMRASVRMTRYLESWGAVKPFAHLQNREGFTTDTIVNGKSRCKVSMFVVFQLLLGQQLLVEAYCMDTRRGLCVLIIQEIV